MPASLQSESQPGTAILNCAYIFHKLSLLGHRCILSLYLHVSIVTRVSSIFSSSSSAGGCGVRDLYNISRKLSLQTIPLTKVHKNIPLNQGSDFAYFTFGVFYCCVDLEHQLEA